LDVSRRDRKTAKKIDPSYPIKNEVATAMVGLMSLLLITYTFHCTWVTSEAYSSPSIVLSAKQHDGSRVIFDDFREAYYWLRQNTPEVHEQFIHSHLVIFTYLKLVIVKNNSPGHYVVLLVLTGNFVQHLHSFNGLV